MVVGMGGVEFSLVKMRVQILVVVEAAHQGLFSQPD
jgi:hypothetical protein